MGRMLPIFFTAVFIQNCICLKYSVTTIASILQAKAKCKRVSDIQSHFYCQICYTDWARSWTKEWKMHAKTQKKKKKCLSIFTCPLRLGVVVVHYSMTNMFWSISGWGTTYISSLLGTLNYPPSILSRVKHLLCKFLVTDYVQILILYSIFFPEAIDCFFAAWCSSLESGGITRVLEEMHYELN